MVYSKFTDQAKTTAQRSSRNGRKIDRIILHHQASTNDDATIQMMVSGSKQVSANYTVSNTGRVTSVVPEEFRAWTSSSAEWDGRAITFEVANLSTNGWTISDASVEAIARVIADASRRYGFPLTRAGANSTVISHRELYQWYGASYATACPGGMDVDRIVRRANELLNGDDGVSAEDLYNTRGNDQRNLFDGVIENRTQIKNVGNRQEEINARAERRHAETLAAVAAVATAKVDEKALAAALAPSLAAILNANTASSDELKSLRADILAAMSRLPQDTLSAFGLKRV